MALWGLLSASLGDLPQLNRSFTVRICDLYQDRTNQPFMGPSQMDESVGRFAGPSHLFRNHNAVLLDRCHHQREIEQFISGYLVNAVIPMTEHLQPLVHFALNG